jgi:DNA-binding response OmpR family regulator
VEDRRDSAEAIRQLLRLHGHDALIAGSCDQARKIYTEKPVDLLLCDLGLPDGDGCDLLNELFAIRPAKAPAITGYGTSAAH